MKKELMRLFKCYYSESVDTVAFNKEAMKYGLLAPENIPVHVLKEAIDQYGKDGVKWNKTFHKSFDKVASAPIEELYLEQLMHYLTVYGFESIDCFDEDTVYIPKEKLEIPEVVVDDLTMIIIRPLTQSEIDQKLAAMLTSGIALSKTTVEDITNLINLGFCRNINVDDVKNREIKNTLYDLLDTVPNDPEEFLRYLIYKTVGSSLKIKDRQTIQSIKNHVRFYVDKRKYAIKLLNNYLAAYLGCEKLSSIFLRNKELFLAFKVDWMYADDPQSAKEINNIINRLKRLSKKNHKPMKSPVLDRLTSIKSTDLTDEFIKDLENKLDNITVFRELRILNALRYRLNGSTNDIVYKIRNGRSFVSETNEFDKVALQYLNGLINLHLSNRIKKNVSGKTVYIPKNIDYALPTSEKMFSGNIPCGTVVHLSSDDSLIYGIHWENLENSRVDLDLKQFNNFEMFGWDASYRALDRSVLFSGDMTDAPKSKGGATELFFVDKSLDKFSYAITVNDFTFIPDRNVNYELMIASSKKSYSEMKNSSFEKHGFGYRDHDSYVVDPNDIILNVPMVTNPGQNGFVVGYITKQNNNIDFTFDQFSTEDTRSYSLSDKSAKIMSYLKNKNDTQLSLRELLESAGANIVDKKTMSSEALITDEDGVITNNVLLEEPIGIDIDLSLENLTKDTFINLLN